ncbi:hypothetical protein [Pleomorphomonas oryzae]|uniref:hypothetical protein n=1 Tax=Pleomorphomonas oryzae TaxID=261934 RepID=UPI000412121B|nr:hypothetical protein [Pleomorphomonas oryzae]
MAKLGFTGFALAGCLALTSCNTTGGSHLPSAFDYPEANAFVDCAVAHAKKRALDKGQRLRTSDLSELSVDASEDCNSVEVAFITHAKANGISDSKLADFMLELRGKAWDRAWGEVAPIRLAQLKAEGKIR